MAAAPFIALEALLAVAAGGDREERFLQVEQSLVDLGAVGLGGDRAGVAGVRDQHLPLAVDLSADVLAQLVHRVGGPGNVVQVDVVGRQIRLAARDKAVSGEVDQHPVVVLGDRGQPRLKLLLDVCGGGVFVDQLVDVLGGKLPALGADQHGVDRFGVAVGIFQLRLGRQVLVLRDADHQRIAARDFDRNLAGWSRRLFLEGKIAVLVVARGGLGRRGLGRRGLGRGCRRRGRRRRRLLSRRYAGSNQQAPNHELRPNPPHRLRQWINYVPTGTHIPPARSSDLRK